MPRGRTPGAPKGATFGADTIEYYETARTEVLYGRLQRMLTPELREYLDKRLEGGIGLDIIKNAELLFAMTELVAYAAMDKALKEQWFSRDLAAIMSEARQSVKDFEEMRRRREEVAEKIKQNGDERGMDTPASDTIDARFNAVLERYKVQAGSDGDIGGSSL